MPAICTLTDLPVVEDWVPGLVTPTVLEMPHLKVVDPLKPALSVTVTVTL